MALPLKPRNTNQRQPDSNQGELPEYLTRREVDSSIENEAINNLVKEAYQENLKQQQQQEYSWGDYLLAKFTSHPVLENLNLLGVDLWTKLTEDVDPDFKLTPEDFVGYEPYAKELSKCVNRRQLEYKKYLYDFYREQEKIIALSGHNLFVDWASSFLNPVAWGEIIAGSKLIKTGAGLVAGTKLAAAAGKVLQPIERFSTVRLNEGLLKSYGRSIVKTIPSNIGIGLVMGGVDLAAQETTGAIRGKHLTSDEILSTLTMSALVGGFWGATIGGAGNVYLSKRNLLAMQSLENILKNPKSRTVENITVEIDPEKASIPGYLQERTTQSIKKAFEVNQREVYPIILESSESAKGLPKDAKGAIVPVTIGIRLHTYPGVTELSNKLAECHMSFVDKEGNVLTSNATTVESLASKYQAIYATKLLNTVNKYFQQWSAKKYQNNPNWAGAKWNSLRKIITGSSADYVKFNEMLAVGARHLDKSPDPIVEACLKEWRSESNAITNEAIKAGVYPIKQQTLEGINNQRKGVALRKQRLENTTKARIPVGDINGSTKYSNVNISTARKHIESGKNKISETQQTNEVLNELLKQYQSGVKDSATYRNLLGKLKEANKKHNKDIKTIEKESKQSENKNLKEILKLEDALPIQTKAISDLVNLINTGKKEAVKYSELTNIGKLQEKLTASKKIVDGKAYQKQIKLHDGLQNKIDSLLKLKKENKGLTPAQAQRLGKLQKELASVNKKIGSKKVQREVDLQRVLQQQIDFLKAIKSSKKGATASQEQRLGALKEKHKNTLKLKKELEERITKEEEVAKTQRTKSDAAFEKALDDLLPKIEELEKNPLSQKTQRELGELIGKIKERIKYNDKNASNLSKQISSIEKELNKVIEKNKSDWDILNKQEEELNAKYKEAEAKDYTVEDLKLLGDESHLSRFLDKNKIYSDIPGFKRAVYNGFKSVSKKRELLEKPIEELTQEEIPLREKAEKQIWKQAESSVNHILSTSGARVDEFSIGMRGSEHQRLLPFSTDHIIYFVNNHFVDCQMKLAQTLIPDTQLCRAFGTYKPEEIVKIFQDKFDKTFEGMYQDDPKTLRYLSKMRDKMSEDVSVTVNHIRGVGFVDPYSCMTSGKNVNNTIVLAKSLQVACSLGGVTLSSLTDVGSACLKLGTKRFLGNGLKTFVGFIKNKITRQEARELEPLYNATTFWLNNRYSNFSEIAVGEGWLAAMAKGSQGLANITTRTSGIHVWDNSMKCLANKTSTQIILEAGEKLFNKKRLTKRDVSFLKQAGLTESQVLKIYDQFLKFGEVDTKSGFFGRSKDYFPRVDKWTDVEARDLIFGAVQKMQNEAIPTPGVATVPQWFENPFLKIFSQFRSFTFGVFEKLFVPFMQTMDLNSLAGAYIMMNISILRTALKMKIAGEELDEDVVLDRALKSDDLFGSMCDFYGYADHLFNFVKGDRKAFQGFFGALKQSSTMVSMADNVTQAGMGALNIFFGDGATESQINAIKRIMLAHNHPVFSHFYNKFFDYVKARFGRPTKKSKRKTRTFSF